MFTVLKFGGTSVATKKNWDNIASILRKKTQDKNKLIVVCSALSGISNLLEKIVVSASKGSYAELLDKIKKKHQNLIVEMRLDFDEVIGRDWDEFEKVLLGVSLLKDSSPRNHARVLAFGEIFSTKIGTSYLQSIGIDTNWLDAREHLQSINEGHSKRKYLSAICTPERDLDLIKSCCSKVSITQGFIARNSAGETVLLGRGGSDVSGAYFAVKAGAKRLEIWTDVPGIFTANPRDISRARLLKNLNYDEAQEIASAGAKVLHPRCIAPVQLAGIPLHLYSTIHPQAEGTIISDNIESDRAQVKAISTKRDTVVISMNTIGMWQQVGFLSKIFEHFKDFGLSINLISTSESNVTVTLDGSEDGELLNKLKEDLEKFCQVEIFTGRATISLVGKRIRAILHQLAPALKLFEEHKIYLLSQSTSDLNIACVVDSEQVDRLVAKLHTLLFKDIRNNPLLGQSWTEIESGDKEEDKSWEDEWWVHDREKLISLVDSCPCYVYKHDLIIKKAQAVKSIEGIDQVFYAMKANNNSEILKTLEKQGIGFECVSSEELQKVVELFPKIDPKRILFTPNFSDKEEYKLALEKKVNVNLDSLYPLQNWGEIFQDKDIFIRVDTGIGDGHHDYVNTAGSESKFGIPPYEFEELNNLLSKYEVTVVGLHAHAGSGIRSFKRWSEVGRYLAGLLPQFPDVHTIDMGGGLGVPEKFGDSELDTKMMGKTIEALKVEYPDLKFWIEPGRFLVAESGVLLAKVNQLKTKGETNYVGINAGMNVLLRPALYGSYHEIINLTRLNEPKGLTANVVGPICESGDILGIGRNLAKDTSEGDIILIGTAGAYGAVMSSNYTMRGKGRELIF